MSTDGPPDPLADFELDTDLGGLILIGPGAFELNGLDALLASPEVDAIGGCSELIMDWDTVTPEVTQISRQASRLIRNGRTAVVHLDVHVGEGEAIPADMRHFVCLRLSQILIGLAETPAYVAIHGDQLAQTLIVDSLGDTDAASVGMIANEFPMWKLSGSSMFEGLPVALCPGNRAATGVAQMLDWFEARRVA